MQGGQTNRNCRRSEAGSEVDKRCRDVRGIEPHKSQTIQQTKQIRFAGFLCSIVIGFGQVCSQMTFDFNMNGPDRRSQTGGKSLWRKEYDHYLSLWTLARIQGRSTYWLCGFAIASATVPHFICVEKTGKDVPWSAPLPKFPSFDLQAQWASFETGWSSRFRFCVEVSKGKEKLLKEQGPWKWYDLRRIPQYMLVVY